MMTEQEDTLLRYKRGHTDEVKLSPWLSRALAKEEEVVVEVCEDIPMMASLDEDT